MHISISSDSPSGDNQNGNSSGPFLVGLGASAGGVKALTEFFTHVRADSGLAYVVILHLSPDYDSKLTEILQSVSQIPVCQVTSEVQIEPNNVYVVSPNQHLTIREEKIIPSKNLEIEDRHAPVDILFRSMAESHGARAICVLLSGTGANGSMGLKRVKEHGGAVFVQNPREAEFNEMPRNAIATELVDEVLGVADIPGKIYSYVNNGGKFNIPVDAVQRLPDEQFALLEVFSQLRFRTSHDFTNYKRPTLLRRIERRIRVHDLDSLSAYANFIQQNPEEATCLLKDLLISVTNFFRDKESFEIIATTVLPDIIKSKTAQDIVRIWVAGCATGEEAYSIAMLYVELTEDMIDAPKLQIFATDIDETAISLAREGLYTINDAADVSPERLRAFFRKETDGYRIRRDIREMILFANHNVIKDPPFSHLDMITCRNLLIYLNNSAQERVMETFHFALNPGAYLFLGNSESIDGSNDLFTPFNREHHIFKSRQVTMRTYPVPEPVPRFDVHKQVPHIHRRNDDRVKERIASGDLHQQLLEKYAPPSIVINDDFEIVHLSPKAGRFLLISGGEFARNLLVLVREELRPKLRAALYKSIELKNDVEIREVAFPIENKTEIINIHVRPVLGEDDAARGYFLVVFEKVNEEENAQPVVLSSDEPITRQLESELIRIKTQLRESQERHEYQAEELKAANEELQAMNEETRSAAEELETSKEELQSINEELLTVNQELKVKVEETTLMSNNLQNLINSVDLATIFLDRGFRVKLFTPAVRKIFNLIPADSGRLLSDITSSLNDERIVKDAEMVLDKLQPVEREVMTQDGQSFLMRVLPYRSKEDQISGIVITFFDITKRKKVEEELRGSEERLRLLMESAKDYAIFTQDKERRVNTWNTGAEVVFGYTEQEIIGRSADIFFTPEDRRQDMPALELEKAASAGSAENERLHLRKDGSLFYGSGMVRPIYDDRRVLIGFLKIIRDTTEKKFAEDALRESEERLRVTMNSAVDYAIITLDVGGRISSWSKGAEIIFGYTEDEMKGKYTNIIFTPEDRESAAAEAEMESAARQGRAVDERWHIRKDGSRFYMSGVMTPIMNNGRLTGYVKVARDMTATKLIQQQQDEFIGIASHELKTPVTSIKSYSELLLQYLQSGSANNALALTEKLNVQVDRLVALIKTLLDTTRISEGKLSLHVAELDLNSLVAQCVLDLQQVTNSHKISFVKEDIPNVLADGERIEQVMINLLINAITYSPAGGDIVVKTKSVAEGVQVSVADQGIGIKDEIKQKIFDRFYQATGKQTDGFSGMGLGLYISAGIIVRHGGKIGVENGIEKGSVFYFVLPHNGVPKED